MEQIERMHINQTPGIFDGKMKKKEEKIKVWFSNLKIKNGSGCGQLNYFKVPQYIYDFCIENLKTIKKYEIDEDDENKREIKFFNFNGVKIFTLKYFNYFGTIQIDKCDENNLFIKL